MSGNLILNIPHASTTLDVYDMPLRYPEPSCYAYWHGGGRGYVKNEHLKKYRTELLYMTDWYTDELFINGIGEALVSPVSRLVCDMERFRDPEQEPMEKIGMGVCYRKKHDLTELAQIVKSHREMILKKYYDPYHERFSQLVDRTLHDHGSALILDCHSFSAVPLPYEPDQDPDRPDICIGIDDFHTPKKLIEDTEEFFGSRGYRTKLNSPYNGTIVTPEHLKKTEKVMSIMLEINRGLYLKPGTNEKNEYFETLKQHIAEYEMSISARYL